jgi:sarcosine oxidase subunit gamma
MSALTLEAQDNRERLGLKGPRAAEWLAHGGIDLPEAPNTWIERAAGSTAPALLVARLGSSEFFLEEAAPGTILHRLAQSLHEPAQDGAPAGVYPVLREDSAFILGGAGVHDVLAQVCNVNFAALALDSRPLIMTLMIGVAVLVVPQRAVRGPGAAAARPGEEDRRYRIWCDPTFGAYLGQALGGVIIDCGGRYTGVSS